MPIDYGNSTLKLDYGDSGLSPQVASEDAVGQVPDGLEEETDPVRDAYYYNRQFGIPAETALELQPELKNSYL